MRKDGRRGGDKPELNAEITVEEFLDFYWLKEDLVALARALGLPTGGYKPELSARIERRLRGLEPEPEAAERPRARKGAARDSDRPLTRETPVVHYKSDQKTRDFFKGEIGSHFHFTYHVNQYRLSHSGLTYGDLIDEWLAEFDRRKAADYKAPLSEHGKYNRFVRAYFADESNRGKSLADAAKAWNRAKNRRGEQRYEGGEIGKD